MEVWEHSKYKPLSITLAVEHKTRLILGYTVSSMPAKGLLAKKAFLKYGRRRDERVSNRKKMFGKLVSVVDANAIIKSDQHPQYPPLLREFFPKCAHVPFKGVRGCVTGQGELKGGGFDPLFSINHTCAMLRANINRLFRQTWCTTKKKERLLDHIVLFANYHNDIILERMEK